MMKAAAGLVKVNTGSVTYQDMPIGVESKKHISYMSTEPFYYDYMKIRFPAAIHAADTGSESQGIVLWHGGKAENCGNTFPQCGSLHAGRTAEWH